MLTMTLIEIDDRRWNELVGEDEFDPYCGHSYLTAVTAMEGVRALLVVAEGNGWSARYPLVLRPLPHDRWLARTPAYGGPVMRLFGSGVAAVAAARECRDAVDEVLANQGVISEVFLLSPWLPERQAVATAWSAREGKPVCLVVAAEQGDRWRRLRKGRRSDITRARRELDLNWGLLDGDGAARFADQYRLAMDRVGAAERWRLNTEWFQTLVEQAPGRVLAAATEGPSGGATALFLTSRTTAAYFLACRWGEATGGPSLALWTGIEELIRGGVQRITLGGGAADSENDPVLAFKRSFADLETPLLIGSRVFDTEAHFGAVAEGLARPLPSGVVVL